jgi:phage tail-like protein
MPNAVNPDQISSYLDHLPAIFQEDVDNDGVNFIGRFLLAFEHLLSGVGDSEEPGLEEIIGGIVETESGELHLSGIHRFFDPGPDQPERHRAPADFLEWLAGWVALSLRDDWREKDKRRIISEVVSRYCERGTRKGLEDAIQIYTKANLKWEHIKAELKWEHDVDVRVDELDTPFQIGVQSTIGEDTWIEGGPPNYFEVFAPLKTRDPDIIGPFYEVLTAIIDLEKPAYTHYHLELKTPAMQIGQHSTIGRDTLLGTWPFEEVEK